MESSGVKTRKFHMKLGIWNIFVLFAVTCLVFCSEAVPEVIRHPGISVKQVPQKTEPTDKGLDSQNNHASQPQRPEPTDRALDQSMLESMKSEMTRRYPDNTSARNNAVADWVVESLDNRLHKMITYLDIQNGKLPTREEIMSFSGSADALRATSALVVDLSSLKKLDEGKVIMEGFEEALKLYELKRQLTVQPNSIWNYPDGWKPEEAMSLYVVNKPNDIFKVNLGELLKGGCIWDFPIKDLKLRNLKRSFYTQITLPAKNVKMAIHELQNDKVFLNQAIDVRKRAENLLDNDKFIREDKKEDLLFPELGKYAKNDSVKGGKGKEGEQPIKAAASETHVASASEIGVKGWCHCWDKEAPGEGSFTHVGWGDIGIPDDVERQGDFAYKICNRCGKCFTYRTIGDNGEADIIDLRIYRMYHEEAGRSIPTHKYAAMLREAEDKVLAIPDGHIVISGTCKCKRPDPIKTGFVNNDEFYVCCFCGRIRLPDKNGGMPVGPTAKWWSERKSLSK